MKIKTRRYYIYYIARIAVFLINLLPIRLVSKVAFYLGRIGYLILKKQRVTTLDNLRSCFKDKTDSEIERIARDVFSNIARNFAEFVSISKINKKNIGLWVRSHGLERIDETLKGGKGGIIMASHFGNWELLAAYLRIKGYRGPVIARKIYFHKFNDLLMKLRSVHGLDIMYRDESPKTILKILKGNGLIGMLADQDIDNVEGVFVDFFGRPAYTPTAPVKFAMASGAPILPCFMIRKGNRYDFAVEDPIYVEKSSDREDTVKNFTQKWSSVLESYIRRYPEQWVWMHRRWKTKPQKLTAEGHLQAVCSMLLLGMLCFVFFLGGCGKKSVAEKSAEKIENIVKSDIKEDKNELDIKHKMHNFKLEGFTKTGENQWSIEGEFAKLVEPDILLSSVKGRSFNNDVSVMLTADKGVYNRVTNSTELDGNVVIVSSDGGRICMDFARWDAANEEVKTDSHVRIDYSGVMVDGEGALVKPKKKWAMLEKGITAKDSSGRVITCDGPLEVDYENRKAIFNNNVEIIDQEGKMYANQVIAYFDPENRKIDRIEWIGDVKAIY